MKRLFVTLLMLPIMAAVCAQTTLRFDKPTYSIVNNKPWATFDITVPTGGSFYVACWIQGVKHADGTFSTYTMRIDDAYYYDNTVIPSAADWGYSGLMYVYLTMGPHKIHVFSYSLDDVPNVESLYVCSQPIPPSGQDYTLMKTHSQLSTSTLSNYRKTFTYSTTGNGNKAPASYIAQRDQPLYYTFRRLEYYTAGQQVTVNVTDKEGEVADCIVNIFRANESTTNNVGVGKNHATANITISDFYYVMLSTDDNSRWGTCSFNINESRYFKNVPLNCYKTPIYEECSNNYFSCFVIGQNCDPMVMVYGVVDNIYGYNDDCEDSSVSDFHWGTDACVVRIMHVDNGSFATLYNSLPKTAIQAKADIYTGLDKSFSNYLSLIQPYFPNYKMGDHMISGCVSSVYNGLAWALGRWDISYNYWMDSYTEEDEAEWVEWFANLHGYTTNGATESNAVIDIYKNNGYLSFATVKSKGNYNAAGYAWESKLDYRERVFHPRYSLGGGSAGSLAYHLKKLTANAYTSEADEDVSDNIVIENAELNSDEWEFVERGVSAVPEEVSAGFEKRWETCVNEREWGVFLSLKQFERLEHYPALVDYCKANPSTLFLVCRLVDKGDVMAVKLLGDMTASKHSDLLNTVLTEKRERKTNPYGKTIVRPVRTEAILYMKALFNGGHLDKALAGVSYSSDPKFTIEQHDMALTVTFELDRDAQVSVGYSCPQKGLLQYAVNGQQMQAGRQEVHFDVPEAGIYVFAVNINGSVYEKKVVIK